ncbi:type 4a pilus biogenesis protein PilO [Microbacterium horticulturae]|uniref:Type 4a pilus biogenesis protein PilO n=1 Tax=Microbacterium horticulturae TaxID=3028316 RepID=A0ABY8C134_9MICO|nr:type 4a pilus biogenesis protein PilO [Microbacterium sp. KACC 23027]WEG10118.1 type 4a pilus biogenesis protein PilO [Microbacterium sp. KACC 23027]
MDKFRLSLIVIAALAVGVLAGGWFLGVQPQLDRISTAEAQTASIAQLNDVQQIKNAALRADNEHLGDDKRQLAALEKAIPASRSQQALINQFDAAAKAADVTIRTLTFSDASAYAAPTGVTVGLPSAGALVEVPLTMAVNGSRADLEKFVGNLQDSPRIVTISESRYTGPDDASMNLTGLTWVLVPAQ